MATKTSILNKITDNAAAAACQTESINALVSDFGEHAENGWAALPSEFVPTFEATDTHLRTLAKDVRTTEIVGLTTLLVAAGGQAVLTPFMTMTMAANAAGVTRRTGPTPEMLACRIAERQAALNALQGELDALVGATEGVDQAMVMAAAVDVPTVKRLTERAGFLAKLGQGGGSTGTKARPNRQLANVPDGTVVLFSGVSALVSGGTLVIEGDVAPGAHASPSAAAVAVRLAQGAKSPSVNGWDNWKTADQVKLSAVHDAAEGAADQVDQGDEASTELVVVDED